MLVYLKVKIKSLAAEAKIIRIEEHRFRPWTARMKRRLAKSNVQPSVAAIAGNREAWLGLKDHRRFDVRNEARAAHLAYGFLRDMPYRRMEPKCHSMATQDRIQLWAKINRLVTRYGPPEYRDPKEADKYIVAWSKVVLEPAASAE